MGFALSGGLLGGARDLGITETFLMSIVNLPVHSRAEKIGCGRHYACFILVEFFKILFSLHMLTLYSQFILLLSYVCALIVK